MREYLDKIQVSVLMMVDGELRDDGVDENDDAMDECELYSS